MTNLGNYLALGKKLYRARQKHSGIKKIKLKNDVAVVIGEWTNEKEEDVITIEQDILTNKYRARHKHSGKEKIKLKNDVDDNYDVAVFLGEWTNEKEEDAITVEQDIITKEYWDNA